MNRVIRRDIFPELTGRCIKCNTPTDGKFEYRGDLYCHEHYEKVVSNESIQSKLIQNEIEWFSRFVTIVVDANKGGYKTSGGDVYKTSDGDIYVPAE